MFPQRKNTATRGRVVIVVLLMAMTTAGLAMAVHWQLGRFRTGVSQVQDNRRVLVPDGRVRLARVTGNTTAPDPPQVIAEEHPESVEDENLGKLVLQPRTPRIAPPAPPRASVDPEPQAPEDPRDFELPTQDHGVGHP